MSEDDACDCDMSKKQKKDKKSKKKNNNIRNSNKKNVQEMKNENVCPEQTL